MLADGRDVYRMRTLYIICEGECVGDIQVTRDLLQFFILSFTELIDTAPCRGGTDTLILGCRRKL